MKLICTQENLKHGLMIVSKIISSNNTLPILNNLLLKTEGGQLKISSTNLEIAINTTIRCKIEEEGGTTVLAKTINDLINNLPNKNLEINTEKNEVAIKTEHQKYFIKTLPAEEFPFIPQTTPTPNITLKPEEVKEAVDKVVFSAATNQTQPEISGVLFSIKNNKTELAATDRYRLAEKRISTGGREKVLIIPQKTAHELSRILSLQPEEVEVGVNENQVFFTIGPTQIISRQLDGQYPPYKNIIPESFNTQIVVSRQKLQTALKTSALFSLESNTTKIHYSKDKQLIIVSSESQELGSGTVEILSQIEGESGELLINYKYLLDFLSQTTTETIRIKIVNNTSPIIFLEEGKEEYLYLVMPIKI